MDQTSILYSSKMNEKRKSQRAMYTEMNEKRAHENPKKESQLHFPFKKSYVLLQFLHLIPFRIDSLHFFCMLHQLSFHAPF